MTDDATIRTAVTTAMEAPEAVLEAMFRAIYAWRDSGEPSRLTSFADAALATIDVHTSPGYDKTLAAAPVGPTKRGRSPEEIFAARGY